MPKKKKDSEETEEDLEALEDEEKEEKSDEEEKLTNLDLKDLEFHQLMQPLGESEAPVLERLAGEQQGPIFVGMMPQGTSTNNSERSEDNGFKYVSSSEQGDDVKYMAADSGVSMAPERVDIGRIGRNGFSEQREMSFQQSSEATTGNNATQERMWATERFDSEKERRKDIFEREEAKYEKYKPDLPSGR